MRIKLIMNGEERIFSTSFIPGRVFRRAVEIQDTIDFNELTVDTLDTLVDFLVEAYGNQFTRDDVYDGIAANELFTVIGNTVKQVINGVAGNQNAPTKKKAR
jgi:hypothetical protein